MDPRFTGDAPGVEIFKLIIEVDGDGSAVKANARGEGERDKFIGDDNGDANGDDEGLELIDSGAPRNPRISNPRLARVDKFDGVKEFRLLLPLRLREARRSASMTA